MCPRVHVYVHVHVHVYVHVYVYAYVQIYVYVCVYAITNVTNLSFTFCACVLHGLCLAYSHTHIQEEFSLS